MHVTEAESPFFLACHQYYRQAFSALALRQSCAAICCTNSWWRWPPNNFCIAADQKCARLHA